MALSRKQRRALSKAKKGGITKKESKQLKSLGIPKRQAKATENKKSDNKKKDKKPVYDQNSGTVNSGRVTNLSSNKQIKLAAKGQLFNGPPGSGNVGPVKDPQPQKGNKNKGPKFEIPEYGGRMTGEYTDILQSLEMDIKAGQEAADELKNKGVREVRGKYKDDLQNIRDVRNAGSGYGPLAIQKKGKDVLGINSGKGKGKGKNNNATPNNKGAVNNNPGGKRSNGFSLDYAGPSNDPFNPPDRTRRQNAKQFPGVAAPFTGNTGDAQRDNADTGRSVDNFFEVDPLDDLNALLAKQQESNQALLNSMESGFASQIKGLELQVDELGAANDGWAAANSFLTDQLSAANAARDLAEKRASNLRNAFVPQANPTALSVAYGDMRRGNREAKNNQLSDLSILSGLGTISNPLAGLQLA